MRIRRCLQRSNVTCKHYPDISFIVVEFVLCSGVVFDFFFCLGLNSQLISGFVSDLSSISLFPTLISVGPLLFVSPESFIIIIIIIIIIFSM